MSAKVRCPGCNGLKTHRAALCAECRRRANSVGEQVWTDTRIPTVPSRPRTKQQNTVYHARATELASIDGGTKAEIFQRKRDLDRSIKDWASARFGRKIVSSTEFTEIEMELVLERLNQLLDVVAAKA